jgi:protocatechuate 3,4-dioxygenase beta subunit
MDEQELTDEVVGRLSATPDPRLREVIQALVRHLHAFTREVRLTESEWLAAVAFLTETGQRCDANRQEFILLSDTLGLSSQVDLVNHGADDPALTEPTILGPFYVPGSPHRGWGESMVEFDDGGEPAVVRGRVLDVTGSPVPGAEIDCWQNAANGFYAVQQPGVQPITNLRGLYTTGPDGSYEIRTVRPTPYSIPADGPVGALLEATGRHPWRAAHLHAIVRAQGYQPVTTHIFDSASDYLDSDTVFGVKATLIRDFRPGAGGVLVCEHDIVLRSADPAAPGPALS